MTDKWLKIVTLALLLIVLLQGVNIYEQVGRYQVVVAAASNGEPFFYPVDTTTGRVLEPKQRRGSFCDPVDIVHDTDADKRNY